MERGRGETGGRGYGKKKGYRGWVKEEPTSLRSEQKRSESKSDFAHAKNEGKETGGKT